jgi:uncharacterized alkaline shock family protein YloU
MSKGHSTVHGKIEVSPQAICRVASRAVMESYGVVGLANPHVRDGLAELLQRDLHHKGVHLRTVGSEIVIDVYIITEYGTRISEVARNVASAVKFAVEKAVGLSVAQVNVNVQGLRISDRD